MAINSNGTISASISWSQSELGTITTTNSVSDVGNFTYTQNLTSGTGNSQINEIWHEVATLISGGQNNYDLQNLSRSVFGSTVTVTFTGIKALIVENLETGVLAGYDITLRATGSDAWNEPFGNVSGNMPIPSDSPFLLSNYTRGWAVDATNKAIQVIDGGSGSQYRIAILGVSG